MYILFIILTISTELITDNINKIISNDKYPIILYNKNKQYFTIISSNGLFYVNKETKDIEITKILNSNFSPPLFICIDESNNYFLFENKEYYQILLDSEFKITHVNYLKTLSTDFQYSGYIKAGKFDDSLGIWHARCNVNSNEIIIYGKKNSNIYFYFISINKYYSVEISSNLGSNISCKLIKNVKYICAYRQGANLMIGGFVYIYEKEDLLSSKFQTISKVEEKEVSEFSNYDNPIIYDTSGEKTKILCVLNTITSFIKTNQYF